MISGLMLILLEAVRLGVFAARRRRRRRHCRDPRRVAIRFEVRPRWSFQIIALAVWRRWHRLVVAHTILLVHGAEHHLRPLSMVAVDRGR